MTGTSRIAIAPLLLALATVAAWSLTAVLIGGGFSVGEGWNRAAWTLLAVAAFRVAYAVFIAAAVITHWPTADLAAGARLGVWAVAIGTGVAVAWFVPQTAPVAAVAYLIWHIAHRVREHRRLSQRARETLAEGGARS